MFAAFFKPRQILTSLVLAVSLGVPFGGAAQAKTLVGVFDVEVTSASQEWICLLGGCIDPDPAFSVYPPGSIFAGWTPTSLGTLTIYSQPTGSSATLFDYNSTLAFDSFTFDVRGTIWDPNDSTRWSDAGASGGQTMTWDGFSGTYNYEDDNYPYYERTNIAFSLVPAVVPLTASSGLLITAMLAFAAMGYRRRSAV